MSAPPGLALAAFRCWALASSSVRHVVTVKVLGIRVSRDVVTLTASEGGRCTFTERHRSCERTPVRVPAAARQPCRTEPSRLLPLRRYLAAVLSPRGECFADRRTIGASAAWPDPLRHSEPPMNPAALIGFPKSRAGFLLPRTLPLAGLRARDVRTDDVAADKNVCPTSHQPPGPIRGPISAHGFSAPFQRRRYGEYVTGLHPLARRVSTLLAGVAVPSAY
jgi:hypothetical protein